MAGCEAFETSRQTDDGFAGANEARRDNYLAAASREYVESEGWVERNLGPREGWSIYSTCDSFAVHCERPSSARKLRDPRYCRFITIVMETRKEAHLVSKSDKLNGLIGYM